MITEEKTTMTDHPADFNKAANRTYRELSDEHKKVLEEVNKLDDKEVLMTKQEICMSGQNIFDKIKVWFNRNALLFFACKFVTIVHITPQHNGIIHLHLRCVINSSNYL